MPARNQRHASIAWGSKRGASDRPGLESGSVEAVLDQKVEKGATVDVVPMYWQSLLHLSRDTQYVPQVVGAAWEWYAYSFFSWEKLEVSRWTVGTHN